MPKQPKPIIIKCQCNREHEIEIPDLVKELGQSHMSSMLDYLNEIDWLKQRIEELEDQLFVMVECEPMAKPTSYGDITPRQINMGDML